MIKQLGAVLSLLWLCGAAHAQKHCGPDDDRCIAQGTWEVQVAVGAGVRTNPLAESSDVPLVLIPQVSYYGKRFFLDNLDLGYTLVDRPKWMLNVLVTPSRDGLYFFRDDLGRFVLDGGVNMISDYGQGPQLDPDSSDAPAIPDENGQYFRESPTPGDDPQQSPSEQPLMDENPTKLHKRRVAAMAGLEASARLGGWDWQLQALTDVTGIHDGEELRFALSRGTQAREHQLGLALGFSWKSAEVMEYYYGVTEGEASSKWPAYRPGSGASPFVRLSWSRPASESWRWLGSIQYEHLSDAVRNSPLIDQNQVMQIFVGGVYHF